MTLEPIRVRRVVDEVIERITELITSGAVPGDAPLPAERKLAEQLGVSRPVIREAMGALEALGLVTVVRGRGRFPGSLSANGASPPWLVKLPSYHREVLHLLDVREALEVKSVTLAVKHRTRKDLARLKALVRTARRESGRAPVDHASMQRLDTEFHRAIAASSGNTYLVTLISLVVAALQKERMDLFAIPGRARLSVQEHQAVLDALVVGNVAAAQRAIRRHVSSVRATLTAVSELARARGARSAGASFGEKRGLMGVSG
jgi:GntR family transcriptional repressor for pyruvate dehydrogenase complex